MPDGTVNKCKDCNKVENRNNWYKNREDKILYDKKRYRFSIQRIFNQRYSGIKWRCTKQRSNGKEYNVKGKQFISKADWLSWCYDVNNFKKFMKFYILIG